MPRLTTPPKRLTALPARLKAPSVVRGDVDPAHDDDGRRRSVHWLKTWRWQQLRLKIIKRDNALCQATGAVLIGRHPAPNSPVVDHIVPHRGDARLFWDEDNLQTVSKAWHDKVKQSLEKRGLA